MDTAHPPRRSFADARALAPVVWEVFGTDRRITTVDRLTGGTRKGVYRVVLDDATSAVVYRWSPDEDYWSGLLPDGHDDPADPFSHASGLDLLEGATRRLEAVGARVPRLLFTDRGRGPRPVELAVAEDVRGGTLESLLERDPAAGRRVLAELAAVLRRMHTHRAPAFGRVGWLDGGGAPTGDSCERAYRDRALVNLATAVAHDPRAAAAEGALTEKLDALYARVRPRAELGVVHGELGPDHVLVGPDGEPVLIDVEGLLYADAEVEHCWLRMRFGPHRAALHEPALDPRRLAFYRYAMHLDLVGGPLRIAAGDFPDRQWMLEIADHHLRQALAYRA
ncbi:aminoglycoside phosphotransferase [Kitasatospora phosalacinea]|uniref:Aminoglycoside phosphotransferase n=1 Tax=Kitasatospora phosalacinea TaxID=2065 RepID=A0A9W6QCX9_9ACTN|nr:phosphotransferase [Kitasatospora phosalacinea]GLW72774.1 aminoglycoside phosphotransferase [Kitasatospora phosalacinea]